jgi:hypothetical protein
MVRESTATEFKTNKEKKILFKQHNGYQMTMTQHREVEIAKNNKANNSNNYSNNINNCYNLTNG